MFENATSEELQKELDRRRAEEDEARKPKTLSSINTSALQKICCEYIDDLASDGYVDEDYEQYIFEAAMEAVFGKDVWKFTNDKLG